MYARVSAPCFAESSQSALYFYSKPKQNLSEVREHPKDKEAKQITTLILPDKCHKPDTNPMNTVNERGF